MEQRKGKKMNLRNENGRKNKSRNDRRKKDKIIKGNKGGRRSGKTDTSKKEK